MKARLVLLIACYCLHFALSAQYFTSYSFTEDAEQIGNLNISGLDSKTSAHGKFYYTGTYKDVYKHRLFARSNDVLEEVSLPSDLLTYQIESQGTLTTVTDENISFLSNDRNHDLLVGTFTKILRYKNNSWEVVCDTYSQLGAGDIINIKSDYQNTIWFTYRTSESQNLLCKVVGNTIIQYPISITINEYIDRVDADLEIDPLGNIWMVRRYAENGAQGLARFDGSDWVIYTKENGLISNDVYCIEAGPDGQIWFGTNEGISIFNDGQFVSTITADRGMKGIGVEGLSFDGTNMFVCSYYNSQYFVQMWIFDDFRFFPEAAGTESRIATVATNGNVWFYSEFGDIYTKYHNVPAAKLAVEIQEYPWTSGDKLDFCRNAVNTPLPVSLRLTNTSFLQNLSISQLEISGPDADQFSLDMRGANLAISKSSGTTCKLVFKPTRIGEMNAVLNIYSNDFFSPVYTIPLAGLGTNESIVGPTTFCNGETTATYQAISDFPSWKRSYQWELPENFSITSHSPNYSTIQVSVQPGSNQQIVKALQSESWVDRNCVLTEHPLILTLEGGPVALGPITGSAELCANTSAMYQVNSTSESIQWTCTGCSIISGQGTTVVQVKKLATGLPAQLQASVNSCGQVITKSFSILEKSVLTTPVITGNADFCLNQPLDFSVENHSGSQYQWEIPAGYTILSGQGTSSVTLINQGIPALGSLTVTERNSCGNSLPASLALNPQSFSLSNAEFSCSPGAEVYVSVNSNSTLVNGIIGIDFTLKFDANKLVASGNYQLGTTAPAGTIVSINKNTPGQVSVTMFLSSLNNTFNGSGSIVRIGFKRAAGFAINTSQSITCPDGIHASTFLGSIEGCVPSPAQITYPSYFTGKIFYQGSGSLVLAGGGTQRPTFISLANSSCVSDPSSQQTDANGVFKVIGTSTLNKLRINRDVPGDRSYSALACSQVNAFINGQDALLASQISSKTITPTLFQLLAADVNLDGKVTAADATLIQTRSVNAINCEFPQSHNYTLVNGNLQPNAQYVPSTDWLFIDATYFNSAAFKANASASLVPKVPSCLTVSGIMPTTCNTGVNQNFIAILLGDVNANWNAASASTAKTAELAQLQFHMDEMENPEEGIYWIPLSASSNKKITSLDFTIDYIPEYAEVLEIESLQESVVAVNFIEGNRVMWSSYAENGFGNAKQFRVKVKSKNIPELSSLGQIQAYINGENTRIGAFAQTIEAHMQTWSVSPNPFHEKIMISGVEGNSEIQVELLSMQGHVMMQKTIQGNELIIDTSIPPGTYLLKLEYLGVTKMNKIVKY
ncbi:MAG: T9SS type A sorting domain-containing protein [Cytophagaceae bacterium]|jgi:hypothetical protein|nr:T9SS type A sorting domain-containing protein [Cytophagaceae bacterium]